MEPSRILQRLRDSHPHSSRSSGAQASPLTLQAVPKALIRALPSVDSDLIRAQMLQAVPRPPPGIPPWFRGFSRVSQSRSRSCTRTAPEAAPEAAPRRRRRRRRRGQQEEASSRSHSWRQRSRCDLAARADGDDGLNTGASAAGASAAGASAAAAMTANVQNFEMLNTDPESDEINCREWLKSLDGGKGILLQYATRLKAEFDGDLYQIAASRLREPISPGNVGCIDPSFWDACGFKTLGHKFLFARGIIGLSQTAEPTMDGVQVGD